MWWTVAKEAATNWSSHKDARHDRATKLSAQPLGMRRTWATKKSCGMQ
jgi:hypothetical protein